MKRFNRVLPVSGVPRKAVRRVRDFYKEAEMVLLYFECPSTVETN